ncbi:MAG: PIN domain-containing protein [Candidatus Thermoplasmatota archaeon]|nr:PIN domain-containing protein [Candidatus Thermoplasmatota archaeon]
MNYIDTNVIISYLNGKDINHSKALNLFKQVGDKVTSQIGILELRSMLSRTSNLNENEIEAYIEYLPEIGIKIPEIDINEVFSNAGEIAFKVKMKTLDTLHISACIILNANTFMTFDREFAEKKHVISDMGVTVISG